MKNQIHSARLSIACLILSVVLMAGCDMGTYQGRYETQLGDLQRRATMTENLHMVANDITTPQGSGTGMTIRLPKCFDEESIYYNAKKAASSPGKGMPPGIELPGFAFSLEKYVETRSGKFAPVYVYIADLPRGDKDEEELKEEILANVNKNFTNQKMRWESVSITELDGETASWSRIKALVSQPFSVKQGGGKKAKAAMEQMEGHLEVYFKATPQYYLIVCCRTPAEVDGDLKFLDSVESSLGTVKTG